MTTPFELIDHLGPKSVLHVHNHAAGLKAIVVVDNTACGPAIGGTRIAPDVSLEECARLARAMTFKNAAAGLPHGGAKSVIFADPSMPLEQKEQLVRAFACAIADLRDYIPGPDMGTDETSMAWVLDETGRAVGLPRELGGIPLDEIGATGFGVAIAAEVAQQYCDVEIKGARLAIQGFGAVGTHAALQLCRRGAILVAAADSRSTVINPDGIDPEALVRTKETDGRLANHPGVQVLDSADIIGIDCDIWIPAARPDIINEGNVNKMKARLVIQGANIPATAKAEEIMHARGILSVPDFIANAGGVICASVEYHGGNQAHAFADIEDKIRRNCDQVLLRAQDSAELPRTAAVQLAEERVRSAASLRRWG